MFCYKRSFCKPQAEFLVRLDSASSVPTLWSWGDRSTFSMKKIVLWNASSSEKMKRGSVFHCKYCISWKMLEYVHNEHTMGCTMGYMGICILLSLVSPDLDGSQVFSLLVLFCWTSHHRFSTETEFVTMRLHLLRPLQLFLYFRNYMNIAWNLHDNSLRIFTVVLQLSRPSAQPAKPSAVSTVSTGQQERAALGNGHFAGAAFVWAWGKTWSGRTRRPGLKIWRPSVLDSY